MYLSQFTIFGHLLPFNKNKQKETQLIKFELPNNLETYLRCLPNNLIK